MFMGKILQIVRSIVNGVYCFGGELRPSIAKILLIFGTKTKDFSLHPLPFQIASFRVPPTHFLPLHHCLQYFCNHTATHSRHVRGAIITLASVQDQLVKGLGLCLWELWHSVINATHTSEQYRYAVGRPCVHLTYRSVCLSQQLMIPQIYVCV